MAEVAEGDGAKVTAEEMVKVATNPLIRWMWKGFGFLFVGLGTIGIYIPGIPTTSFMVLAAVCFAKSDPKMYAWLLRNPLFGHYIRDFIEGKGIPFVSKVFIIGLMWTAISLSIWTITLAGDPGFGQTIVGIVGIAGTWYVGWKIPTAV
ncbi:MAG: YbaN family protein [Candidatus Poseidoniaceae archaeon]|nr:YbaN family protein [Candidatus Poseidoniaceae archaeon]